MHIQKISAWAGLEQGRAGPTRKERKKGEAPSAAKPARPEEKEAASHPACLSVNTTQGCTDARRRPPHTSGRPEERRRQQQRRQRRVQSVAQGVHQPRDPQTAVPSTPKRRPVPRESPERSQRCVESLPRAPKWEPSRLFTFFRFFGGGLERERTSQEKEQFLLQEVCPWGREGGEARVRRGKRPQLRQGEIKGGFFPRAPVLHASCMPIINTPSKAFYVMLHGLEPFSSSPFAGDLK